MSDPSECPHALEERQRGEERRAEEEGAWENAMEEQMIAGIRAKEERDAATCPRCGHLCATFRGSTGAPVCYECGYGREKREEDR